MTRLYTILLTLLIASPLLSSAHGFDDSTKTATSAQWKKADDQITGKIARPQLTNMKATTQMLHIILQDSSFAKTGLKPVWHGEYSAQKIGAGIQLNYGIYCDFAAAANGKDGDAPATTAPASLSITVNDLSQLTGHLELNHQDLMTMPMLTGIRNECPYYQLESNASAEATAAKTNRSIWLVTNRPDVLPYTPVSRKEYLQLILGNLGETKAHIVASEKDRAPVRSAEEQTAEKKRDLDELSARYSGKELEMRTKMYMDQYKSDEDYQKENIDKATAEVDTTIHFVQGMLTKLSPATLEAPAVVDPKSTEFEGFRDGEPGMVMLARNNPAFWQPGAAQEKPQFFLITWNSEPTDATAQAIAAQITQNLETRSLKVMLGK